MQLLALLLNLAIAMGAAAWAFWPIVERTPLRGTSRIQVADLFSIVLLWQYALLLDVLLHRQRPREIGHVVFTLMLAVILTGLGVGVANTLSRREVRSGMRRILCCSVAAPAAVAAVIAILFFGVELLFYLLPDADVGSARPSRSARLWAAVLAAIVGSRLIFDWALRRPSPVAADRTPAQFPLDD